MFVSINMVCHSDTHFIGDNALQCGILKIFPNGNDVLGKLHFMKGARKTLQDEYRKTFLE